MDMQKLLRMIWRRVAGRLVNKGVRLASRQMGASRPMGGDSRAQSRNRDLVKKARMAARVARKHR